MLSILVWLGRTHFVINHTKALALPMWSAGTMTYTIKLNDNAGHYQWLWDVGLKESAYLIDPKFNDRIGM